MAGLTVTADLIPMLDHKLREVGTAVIADNEQRISVCLSFDAVLVPVVEDNQQ